MTLKGLAEQIFADWDKQIYEATLATYIPPKFIAGLIANESGRDSKGKIKPEATRFEAGVYRHLIAVRDGTQKSYNKIVKADLRDATDDAIRNLSTSYGITQIMGWHCIHNLHCTIADLRNPDKHLFYTVKLLQLNGFPKNATEARMDKEMKEWNTGSEVGKTYHENYVPNAQKVRAYYAELEKDRIHRSIEERVEVIPPQTAQNEPSIEPPKLEDKTVEVKDKAGAVAQSTKMTILGLTVPTVFVGILKGIQDAITNGFIDAKDIGNTVINFVTSNTKYALILIGLIIVFMMLRKLISFITAWIEMITHAIPSWHSVTLIPPAGVQPPAGDLSITEN